jgi:hypothetical protein
MRNLSSSRPAITRGGLPGAGVALAGASDAGLRTLSDSIRNGPEKARY